ncbi:CXXX repeat peptide maturase, partial [Lachnospiraceae bacterium]|nr:CXXX repeat peptide maturase [Lachnospiraceae bacterium]
RREQICFYHTGLLLFCIGTRYLPFTFGLSLDGTKEKHDLARKYKDGRGTYDDVIKNVKIWLQDYPDAGTKATFSHDDLKYLKDSIIHLWNLGIKDVMANIVYEDVWKDGDDIIYEEQLRGLADYIIDNELWNEYSVAFFDETIGLPLSQEEYIKNRCGAGYKTLAFDDEGNIYPCIRFLDMCSETKKKYIIGHVYTGINMDLVRALSCTSLRTVSPEKCLDCEVGTGCGWCVANNYDDEKTKSIFKRTTYLCDMHKANARANQYFWNQYSIKTGKTSPYTVAKVMRGADYCLRYLYFITGDNAQSHCCYKTNTNETCIMEEKILKGGLDFCLQNNLAPIFLGRINHGLNHKEHLYYEIIDYKQLVKDDTAMPIYYGLADLSVEVENKSSVGILLIDKENLKDVVKWTKKLWHIHHRINLFIQDSDDWGTTDFDEYRHQLMEISDMVYESYERGEKNQINVLTDLIFATRAQDCGAGVTSIALAPNGKFYICPGFYYNNKGKEKELGDINGKNILLDKHFFKRSASEPCIDCSIQNCNRCRYSNFIHTNEIHIPIDAQCEINYINAEMSNILQKKLNNNGYLKNYKRINDRQVGKYKTILERTK